MSGINGRIGPGARLGLSALEDVFKWAPLAEDQHDKPGEVWRYVQLESSKLEVVSAE